MKLDVFLVAGEASADMHAAALLRELKRLHPDLKCFGVGGKLCEAEGMEILVPSGLLNVVGGTDWFDKAREVFSAYRLVRKSVRRRLPHIAILLDLPDFNLGMAGYLKKLGVPVCYYISPQVWAWRRYRVKKIRKVVDEMLVLFPFEKEFYDKEGIPSTFVGHPLLESLYFREGFRTQTEVVSAPRIAVLPGSRKSEIRFHAPIVRGAIKLLREQYPNAEFEIPVANTLSLDWVKKEIGSDSGVRFRESSAREILKWSDVAMVASGTATLETALIGTPFCLFYKVSTSSAWIFKTLVRYRGAIGMPNLLSGRTVVKEFFQKEATAEKLTEEISRLIEDASARKTMTDAFQSCREALGKPGASQRAALRVHRLLGQKLVSSTLA